MSIDEDRWINDFHGLELDPDYPYMGEERGNENGILFLAEYYLLKVIKGTFTDEDRHRFANIVEVLQAYSLNGHQIEGLYDRGASESFHARDTEHQQWLRLVSHDNLTAIAALSDLVDLPYAKHIAWHGLKNFFAYDNAYPESPRWFIRKKDGRKTTSLKLPHHWWYWLHVGGTIPKILSLTVFLPFALLYLFSGWRSCGGERGETSKKWLWLLKSECSYKNSWFIAFTRKIFKRRLRKVYGDDFLKEMAAIYYRNNRHPINILAQTTNL